MGLNIFGKKRTKVVYILVANHIATNIENIILFKFSAQSYAIIRKMK